MKKSLCFTLLFLSIYCAGEVLADQIVLENGDTLTGTIARIEDGRLTLKTDYSDPIKIQTAKIKKITTDRPVEVHLSGGEVLKGRLNTADKGQLIVESSEERKSTIVDWDRVKSINPPPDKWEGSITLGSSLQSGNTDRASASIGAEAFMKTGRNRFSLRFLFNYSEENDSLSARNTYGVLKYDYFLTKKTYAYSGVEMLNDEFKNLNLRTVAGPGAGYQIWSSPDKSLGIEAGISFFSEDLDQGEDDQWLAARFAGNLKWRIIGPVIFSDYLVIYPSLESLDEYQLRNEAGLSSPMAFGWALKLSNIIEINSNPPEDVKKSDLLWILGLQYTF